MRVKAARRGMSAIRAAIEHLEARALLSGSWTALSHSAPGGVGTMELLPNGSVMATINATSNTWGLLTPDATGSYANGTWARLAPANYSRLYDATQVLPDGRVFVAGGEYGNGAATGEVYNPLTNAWTVLPSQSYGSFIDANSILLPNGNVLIAPVAPNPSGYTTIFHPSTNTWSQGPKLYRHGSADEQSWVKLSDDSVLMTDGNGTSERYIPSLNQWINDGTVPVSLFDSLYEEGPGIRLSDGRAFFIGSTGQTAIYTPTGTTSPGTWVAGPNVPGGLGTDDAPVAMLPDGTLLCAVGPSGNYNGPTAFYVYDPVANTFSSVTGAPSVGNPPFTSRMLDLPNGQVLYTSGGSTCYVYTPGTTPLTIAQPSITSIVNNPDGSLTLTGTGLNGIDAGASYGDDAQMDSNYPIISLSSGTNVYYARDYNWSSTSVATGSLAETVNFTLPLGIPAGTYSVATAANGIVSSSVPLTISTTANNLAPTVATPPAASPTTVTASTTALSVLGADDAGESNLVYTWMATSVPSGAALPSFSVNGTNASKSAVATFYHAGTYTFKVIITDSGGLSVSSSVSVTVSQTENHITLTPALASLSAGGSQQFSVQAIDQFGNAMSSQPTFTWSVLSGGGTISTTGKYTAPATGTLATIQAADAKFSATAQIGVVSAPWSNSDIGGPGLTGTAYDSTGTFTVKGSGSDIWGTADAFHFVYQTLSGNGTITARVVTQQNTNASAKSGVMIRNSLSSSDQYVLMATTPSAGVTLQDRTTSGGSAVQTAVTTGIVAPHWVRLVRIGNTITGYRSADGVNWITEGSVTVTMGTTVYVGLAVCSHNNSALNTSTFSNVSVVGSTLLNTGFETPVVGTGSASDYLTDPTGASWAFTGTSGIAGNGSLYTSANPTAPQGTQVAFLEQASASISQQVTLVGGTDEISFSAAQRAGDPGLQNFEVLVDGSVVANVTPSGTSYGTYLTNAFTISSGLHTIQFLSLDSAGGDNTALIDNVGIMAIALPSYISPSVGAAYSYNPTTGALSLTSGTLTFTADAGANPLVNLTASGSTSKVIFNTSEHISGLTLSNGAQATVLSLGAARTHSNHNVLVIGTLGAANDPTFLVDSSSKLDLTDNDLIVHSGASDPTGTANYANVNAMAMLGRNPASGKTGLPDGQWNGNGLSSSAATAADTAAGYEQIALGVVLNSMLFVGPFSSWQVGSFNETLAPSDIIVKYTYLADYGLFGQIYKSDAAILQLDYDNGKTNTHTWATGSSMDDGLSDNSEAGVLDLQYGLGTGGSFGPQL